MTPSFEQRLRNHLGAIDRSPVPDADTVARAARSALARREVRRLRMLNVAAVTVVVTGGVGIWAVSSRPEPQPTTSAVTQPVASSPQGAPTTPPPPSDSTNTPTSIVGADAGTGGYWASLPPDPRGPVWGVGAAWTGAEIVVVGGADPDGSAVTGASAYDPAADTWRTIDDDLVLGPNGETGTVGGFVDMLTVWTGDEVIAMGSRRPDGELWKASPAAYDPATDTWRGDVAGPAIVTSDSPHVWTGTELLVWGSEFLLDNGGERPASGTLLGIDPSGGADGWRPIAAPPIADRHRAASVWTGREWIVWGGTDGTQEFADGAAYNPATDTWRVIAESPLAARWVKGVWTGSELLVVAGASGGDRATGNGVFAHADGAAYDPVADTWSAIPDGPAHPWAMTVWTGDLLIEFFKGTAVVFDPQQGTWMEACCAVGAGGASGPPVWTGSDVLLPGSLDSSEGGARFTPTGLGTSP